MSICMFCVTQKPSEGNEDSKKWQNLSAVISGWTKGGDCKKGTKIWGRLEETEINLARSVCTELSTLGAPFLEDTGRTSSLGGSYFLLSGEGGVWAPSLNLIFKCLKLKIILMPQWHTLGWYILLPSEEKNISNASHLFAGLGFFKHVNVRFCVCPSQLPREVDWEDMITSIPQLRRMRLPRSESVSPSTLPMTQLNDRPLKPCWNGA